MMFKCKECGHIFEDGEQFKLYEISGEIIKSCPVCKGSYDEAYICKICGCYEEKEKMYGGICNDCLYENDDFDLFVRMGEKCKETYQVNGFVAGHFTEEEVNQILLRELEKIKVNYFDFVEQDKEWFAKNLRKELNK